MDERRDITYSGAKPHIILRTWVALTDFNNVTRVHKLVSVFKYLIELALQ